MRDLSFIGKLPPIKQQLLFEGPALQPPPNTTYNLINPPNKNEVGYGVAITAAILCTTLVFSRLYSRFFFHKKLDIEDSCAVAALGVFGGFLYAMWMITIHPGIFVHQWNIRLRDLPHVLYHMQLGAILYGNVIMMLKTGILLEWVKIFVPRGFRNSFWWICHTLLGVNILFYVACTLVEIFPCSPREKLWKFTLEGKCIDVTKVNIVSASINCISDVIILLLPQKVIWSLHLSNSRKIGVAAIFAVGLFASICAGVRIHSTVMFHNNDDVLYNASDMGMWCIAEMVAGFFVLCLPALPKIFADSPWMRKIISSFKSVSRSSSSKEQSVPSKGSGPFKRIKPADASLFTDSDKFDSVPLTNFSVTTNFSVQSHNIELGEVVENKRRHGEATL